MKKRLSIGVVLTLIVVVLTLPATVLAGDLFRFRGDSADAYFSEVDSTGCIYTDVSVFATDGRQQSPPGPPGNSSWADIYISKYSACNDDYEQLLAAYGGASLAGSDFQVLGKKLNSATLNTTINVYDYMSDTSFDVNVNLGWTAEGALNKGRSSSQYQSGKCKYHSRWQGSWRNATASGTISAVSTDYAASPSVYGTIQSARSGDMTIGCN